MRRRRDDELACLLDQQDGLIRRGQALRVGLTDDALHHRAGSSGRWQRVLPAVYAAFTGELSHRQRLRAALLYGGGARALVGESTLLRLSGLRYAPVSDDVHLLVPSSTAPASTGFVVVHRTTRMPARVRRWGWLPSTTLSRALIDTSLRLRRLPDVRALLAEAVQDNMVAVDRLRQELSLAPRRGSAHARRAIADLDAGVRSSPEAELRDLFRRSRVLPEPLWNPVLEMDDGALLGSPDGYLADAALAFEMDSVTWHRSEHLWKRTMERRARFTAAGVAVMAWSPRRLREAPDVVLAESEAAYLERLRQRVHVRVRVRRS